MENEIYHIYYGFRSSYTKTASGIGIATSELIDPILPWKKSYIEAIFSTSEKYTIHLPLLFSSITKITLNGVPFLTIEGSPTTTYFCYFIALEKQSLVFKEIETGGKYELLLDEKPVGHILYGPYLGKDLLNRNIGTEVSSPIAIHKIAIFFAILRMDSAVPIT